MQSPTFEERGAPVTIGDRVWVSSHSVVLPGVTLGEGTVVAAGAIVTKDVEPYTIVGGNPAKPIETRNRGLNYELGYAQVRVVSHRTQGDPSAAKRLSDAARGREQMGESHAMPAR